MKEKREKLGNYEAYRMKKAKALVDLEDLVALWVKLMEREDIWIVCLVSCLYLIWGYDHVMGYYWGGSVKVF